MAYWLFKTDPDSYSFADLMAEPRGSTGWGGVRNYQARNLLRDSIKRGDQILLYHSSADPPAIAGIAEVVEESQPDPTAFDPNDSHFDPKSKLADPTWFQVIIRAVRPIDPPITLPRLRTIKALEKMELLRKGSRLSIQPVRESEWKVIMKLAKSAKR